jgi:hypothetical protein
MAADPTKIQRMTRREQRPCLPTQALWDGMVVIERPDGASDNRFAFQFDFTRRRQPLMRPG